MEIIMHENYYLAVSRTWCVIYTLNRCVLEPTAKVSHKEASVVCT